MNISEDAPVTNTLGISQPISVDRPVVVRPTRLALPAGRHSHEAGPLAATAAAASPTAHATITARCRPVVVDRAGSPSNRRAGVVRI